MNYHLTEMTSLNDRFSIIHYYIYKKNPEGVLTDYSGIRGGLILGTYSSTARTPFYLTNGMIILFSGRLIDSDLGKV